MMWLLRRLGRKAFWVGTFLLCGAAFILIAEARFYLSAQPVDGRVVAVETTCTLKWKEETPGGRSESYRSDPIDCSHARLIMAANPGLDYSVSERTRTEIAFTAADGTRHRAWSQQRFSVGDRRAQVGDPVAAAVDPNDLAEIRRAFDITDFWLFGVMVVGAVLCIVIGMPLKNLGARTYDPSTA